MSNITCIDAIAATLSPDQLEGFIRGRIIECTWTSDVNEAKFYMDWYARHKQQKQSIPIKPFETIKAEPKP